MKIKTKRISSLLEYGICIYVIKIIKGRKLAKKRKEQKDFIRHNDKKKH